MADHKHVYGPVVETSDDGKEIEYQACRICGAKKKTR